MRKGLLYIVVAALLSFSAFSCRDRARVIPEKDMEKIYHDMFLTDQVLQKDNKIRRKADTMLVYEPVFRSYGYTTDDFRLSQEEYLKDPEEFGKLMKRVSDRLEKEGAQIGEQIEFEKWLHRYTHLPKAPADSVLMELRGAVRPYPPEDWHMVHPLPPPDSTLADTLAVPDSLAILDSLAAADSLARADSLAKVDCILTRADSLAALKMEVVR